MASMGPSTMTGILPSVRFWAPKSWAPLWNSGVSAVLRYFGPARAVSAASGWRRPTNPSTSPSGSVMGKMIRSRKRSISRPVRAVVGDPGGEHLLVGDAVAAEVVDQPGPAGRRLAGPESGVAGQVLPHPGPQIVASPRVGNWAWKNASAIWLMASSRSRPTGQSRQASARSNIRFTSMSVCSSRRPAPRTIAATARSASTQRSSSPTRVG